ncbi:alpha/beta hydrolase [Variovorax sp. J22R133]|uniref:alpha/beta fold hydrolase n=1 Tax=Variovorax brevis TaxID=3053503 RepID=UPI00257617D8|nr:alpha/beta hydrolase [Variovorax sp. J22R133]MDM0117467.1 alpha/beta hydrolase [Variovorax sp. J22R133]
MADTTPTILFVHGFLDGATVWDPVVAALGERSSDAVRVDLAGMGDRAGEPGPFTLERFAADVGRVVDSIRTPVVLVGQSMGAQVAELVAASHASRVAGLVLLTPVPLAGTGLADDAMQPFRELGGLPQAQRILRRQLSVDLDDAQTEALGALGDRPAPASVAAFADAWNTGHPDGWNPSRYGGPVLIVRGQGDPFVTNEVVASAVAPRFSRPELAVIDKAGHWPHVERPEAFAKILGDFITHLASVNAGAEVRQQGWTQAFAQKSADTFAEAFASDIVLEASVLAEPVAGREQVKAVMAEASQIYESLAFTNEATKGKRTYLEWSAKAFGGVQLFGITILTKDDDGKVVHAAIHHRPLNAALKFSAELGRRVHGRIDASHFHRVA